MPPEEPQRLSQPLEEAQLVPSEQQAQRPVPQMQEPSESRQVPLALELQAARLARHQQAEAQRAQPESQPQVQQVLEVSPQR